MPNWPRTSPENCMRFHFWGCSSRGIFGDSQCVIFLVFAFQRGATDGIDRLALLIHHIVVFEQVFAGFEVLGFDGLLGLHAFATEDAEEIIFEREEKARGAGIALTAGAAAKLIIDAAGFVALGAKN